MTDLGHDLEFGVFATPEAARTGELLELASIADASGLELFTVQDHPYQRRFLDAWTLLTAVATQTSSLRVSTNVTNLPVRPPAVLAKLVASLDALSPDRVELGLGAGAFWDAIDAAGGPRRSPGEAVDALTEAIDVLRQSWTGGTVHVRGDHYTVDGMHAGPVPTRTIPIWLGAAKPRMLRLVGTTADAWIPSAAWAPPARLPDMNAVIDEAATAAGRAPADVRRMYNVSTGRGQVLTDGPRDWPEQLAVLTLEHGMSTFILPTDNPHLLQRWSLEVAPATRALVTAERARFAEPAGVAAGPLSSATLQATSQPVAQAATQATRQAGGPAAAVVSPVVPLDVRPTPDVAPLVDEDLLDTATRPTYVTQAPPRNYDQAMHANAQHLVDIHNHLRSELAQVRDVLDQVERGQLQVAEARSVVNTMSMRQNNWTLGAFCESYCRLVTGHHTLEDRAVFPHLRAVEPGLAPVIDRLEEEHHVIHDVLDAFDRALVALVDDDGTGSHALAGVRHQLDVLSDVLLSHLAYEERELIEPLARHGYR